MAVIEVGRVCYLSRGRNVGRRVVILEIGKGSIATVLRNGRKEKCNIHHLFPTREVVDAEKMRAEITMDKSKGEAEKEKKK